MRAVTGLQRRTGDAQAGTKPSRVLAVVIPVRPQVAWASGRERDRRRVSKLGKKGDEQTPTSGAALGLAAPAAPIGKKDGRRAELFTCQPSFGRGLAPLCCALCVPDRPVNAENSRSLPGSPLMLTFIKYVTADSIP